MPMYVVDLYSPVWYAHHFGAAGGVIVGHATDRQARPDYGAPRHAVRSTRDLQDAVIHFHRKPAVPPHRYNTPRLAMVVVEDDPGRRRALLARIAQQPERWCLNCSHHVCIGYPDMPKIGSWVNLLPQSWWSPPEGWPGYKHLPVGVREEPDLLYVIERNAALAAWRRRDLQARYDELIARVEGL